MIVNTGRILLLVLITAFAVRSDAVAVRYPEGVSRGFLVVTDTEGRKIGEGENQQVAHDDRVTSVLTIHFKDGSFYEDTTVFSQRGVFHLLTDHVVERGPTFKQPMETSIDTSSGRVIVRYADGGKQKTLSEQM